MDASFHPRCHRFIPGVCDVAEPPLLDAGNGHMIRCVIPAEKLVELQKVPQTATEP